jgi:hypothetical protein
MPDEKIGRIARKIEVAANGGSRVFIALIQITSSTKSVQTRRRSPSCAIFGKCQRIDRRSLLKGGDEGAGSKIP